MKIETTNIFIKEVYRTHDSRGNELEKPEKLIKLTPVNINEKEILLDKFIIKELFKKIKGIKRNDK